MTLDTKLILYTGHNSLWSASSCRLTVLRCTTLQICNHYNTIYYIRYIILYSLCRALLKSVMASIMCSFPSSESDVSAKSVCLSEIEIQHWHQFKKYSIWHSRKCSEKTVESGENFPKNNFISPFLGGFFLGCISLFWVCMQCFKVFCC
jgi:hypothetical protein